MTARQLTRMSCTAAVILASVTASGIWLFPTANAADGDAIAPDDTVVLTINGTNYNTRDLDSHIRLLQTQGRTQATPDRDTAIRSLISRELLYQEAIAKGLDKNPDMVSDIESQRRQMLAAAVAFAVMDDASPSEEQMHAFYQQNVIAKPLKEFKAKHIVVDTEEKAKAIITALDKGGNFAALAKAKSAGPTANTGGDIGWLSLNDMVAPIADAIAALPKGKYTKQPIQTQFGWHVILLEDTRTVAPPPYDAVQDRIRATLQQNALEDHIAQLRNQAKIQVNNK